MSRYKTGLDYFPFDIDFFNDPKIEFISAKYGIEGEIVAIKILCKLYRNGYYLKWGEDECLLFSKKVGDNISVELVNNVINELIKRNFFDEKLYDKYQILTSNGIQKRYLEATKRRKEVTIFKEYYLLNHTNADSKLENVYIAPLDVNTGTQRREEKRRVKKTRVNTMSSTEADLDDVDTFIKNQEEEKEHIPFKAIIDYLNDKAKTDYCHTTTATKNKIKARWNEGFRLKDFKIVIDAKVRSWLTDEKMVMYLRPDTLFSASKFEGYLQEGLKFKPKVRCKHCGLTDGYHSESCRLYVKKKEEIIF